MKTIEAHDKERFGINTLNIPMFQIRSLKITLDGKLLYLTPFPSRRNAELQSLYDNHGLAPELMQWTTLQQKEVDEPLHSIMIRVPWDEPCVSMSFYLYHEGGKDKNLLHKLKIQMPPI